MEKSSFDYLWDLLEPSAGYSDGTVTYVMRTRCVPGGMEGGGEGIIRYLCPKKKRSRTPSSGPRACNKKRPSGVFSCVCHFFVVPLQAELLQVS